MPAKGRYKLSPEQFEEKLNELMDFCIKEKKPPIGFYIRQIMGITEDTINNYRKMSEEINEEDETEDAQIKRAFLASIKKLDDFRVAFWQFIAVDNPKLQAFAMFNLKQPFNGGYTDKPSTANGTQIEVTIKQQGLGSDAFE